MSIVVELFGIPRQRAGVAQTTASGATLGEVLADLAARYPQLAAACIDQTQLRPGYAASLNGDRFLTNPQEPLAPNAKLLILSADAGG